MAAIATVQHVHIKNYRSEEGPIITDEAIIFHKSFHGHLFVEGKQIKSVVVLQGADVSLTFSGIRNRKNELVSIYLLGGCLTITGSPLFPLQRFFHDPRCYPRNNGQMPAPYLKLGPNGRFPRSDLGYTMRPHQLPNGNMTLVPCYKQNISVFPVDARKVIQFFDSSLSVIPHLMQQKTNL